MEYNDWADWGQSDWGNGWTTTSAISQNYNRQPTPKEQGTSNQNNKQNKVNQSASSFFENNSVQDGDWFVQNQAQNAQGQSYSLESNNNSICQIENREVAPPDNKQSYETPQIQQTRYESSQVQQTRQETHQIQHNRPDIQQIQLNHPEPLLSQHNRHEPPHIQRNRHEPPQIQQNRHEPPQIQQNRHEHPQIQQNRNEPPRIQQNRQEFPQMQHETQQSRPNQFSSALPPQKGFTPRQPINVSNYFDPNQVSQVSSGQHKQYFSQSIDSFNSQISGPSSYSGESDIVGQLGNENQFSSLGSANVPPVQRSMSVPQDQPTNKHQQLPSNINVGQQVKDLPQQFQHSKPNTGLSQQNSGLQNQQSSFLIGQEPPPLQHSSNLAGQRSNLIPQNSGTMPMVQPPPISNKFSFHPPESHNLVQQSPPSAVPSRQDYAGVTFDSSNANFDQQPTGPPQQSFPVQDEQQSTALEQFSSISLEQQSHGTQPQPPTLPSERPSSAGPQGPNFGQSYGHQTKIGQQSISSIQQVPPKEQGVDNRRYTPSPQLQINKSVSQPPPSQSPHQIAMNTESHENKTSLNQNTNHANPSTFHVSNVNLFPPIATSSPLPSNIQPLENQERIPENKEYPDNSETIAQDFKALKISPPRESEQEAQKHCAIDRNQYLETGQFSAQKENNTYIQNVDANDEGEAPPPGLHRLVTGQGYEPWQIETETSSLPGQAGESTPGASATRHSSPLSSIGGESEGHERDKDHRREVPGEAEPVQGRVVLGQVPTPPQDTGSNRGERERERLERMVVGDHGQNGNTSDDYRQSGRPSRHTRHIRNDSSFEEEERDYSSDRDRRKDDHRHRDRDDRPRRRREHRSPEYRSDEEFDDRRGYHRSGRESRRRRDYSPDRSYYRDPYYREDDSRHHRSYYPREYDDYYRENQRSRPSSRSGSDYRGPLKHSMRVLPGHHYYHDPYVAPSYHDYNLKYSQRTIEYFERMRHVDPAGYAAWYSQYMQGRLMQESSRAFSSDRASVHSGQSSSNQRHGISTPQEVVDDLTREEDEIDYTPRLYDCAHVKGTMDGHGRLLLVEPNYPLDHQKALVNICRLSQHSVDRDSEDFFQSPGPFIPGVTHRNTVLQYLKRISDRSTKSSEKLLYDLVYMTVKGNGEVNGSDVAELLMDSYKNSMLEEQDSIEERSTPVSMKEVTSRFRELLLQGNKTEALEWAMDNGAWGHALFLASKMGERTHNDIMLRFANSIPHNDPLQTLYQLMSGYIPQSATCCADKKWSDWRPHLAMILSNPSGNIDLDRQAIITLGDSLNASGRLFASHFCYVTAQVEFSEFRPEAKLVLLGSSNNQEFSKFASCRSIMLTMCYEYGLKLRQPTFSIPTLQVYKMILAARLIDNGRIKNALQYCELLAQETLTENTPPQKSVVSVVIDISSRLKMLDPVLALSGNTDKDPDWLGKLKQLYDSLPDERRGFSRSPLTVAEAKDDFSLVSSQDTPYHQITDPQRPSFVYSESGPTSIGVPTFQLGVNQVPNSVNTYQPLIPPIPTGGTSFQPLTQPVTQIPQVPQVDSSPPEDTYRPSGFMPVTSGSQPPQQSSSLGYIPAQVPDNSQNIPSNNDTNNGNESSWDVRPPPIIQSSSDTSQSSRNNFFKSTEEQLKAVDESKPTMKVLNEVGGERKKDSGKPIESKTSGKNEEQSSGWFGGIWDKLALRPKNQMRLPDDSNPSIIWDEKKKKWVNLDGDNESSVNTKPPPKASEALPPQGNKYKIQKGKLMKSNYVDVMGNKESRENNGSANYMPSALPPPSKTNFFIPPPVEGNDNAPIDFITPAPHNPVIAETSDHNKQQLSRSSSVSSLSREVQYYMAPPKGYHLNMRASGNAPSAYNSARFPS